MRIVVDNSVVSSWILDDEFSEYAEKIKEIGINKGAFVVPSLWMYEVGNMLVSNCLRKHRITKEEVKTAHKMLQALPFEVLELSYSYDLKYINDFAFEYGLSVYDASYLYLAKKEKLKLATQDRAMRKASIKENCFFEII